jgi:aspartyl-tRNA(Asn)/glutamyl-tRNA(Gln) amidotransferase subunit B
MYKPTIGLEIHIELKTNSKMFCSCKNDPDERHPNVNVCPICMGHPGTLPVINKEAVRKVIKTGLALNCQVPEYSKFDRKNYFYPDLPKGYQISQLYQPLCIKGFLEIYGRKIRIREVHLEEDTGSLVHPENAEYSLVDFNRAGIPLMELATEPDMHSAEEARQFAEELHLIMHYLEVSDADMEKGEMRVEVNISLSKNPPAGGGKLGTKAEIKNLNSFRAVERSIEYEIKRQTEILGKGEKIIQETRGWDNIKGETRSQREKEEAHDYKYFPEPDLPPLHLSSALVDEIRAEIPELPQQRRERLAREYGLDKKNIEIFVYNKDLGEYFEKVISELPPNLPKKNLLQLIKLTSNYIITDLQGLLKSASVQGEGFLITPENFAQFIALIYEGKISSKIAKIVLEEMFKSGADPSHIIEEKDLSQITNEAEIEKIIKEVISKNPKVVEDYKKGKENALQYLIGQIMAKTKGKVNPELTNKILREILTKKK